MGTYFLRHVLTDSHYNISKYFFLKPCDNKSIWKFLQYYFHIPKSVNLTGFWYALTKLVESGAINFKVIRVWSINVLIWKLFLKTIKINQRNNNVMVQKNCFRLFFQIWHWSVIGFLCTIHSLMMVKMCVKLQIMLEIYTFDLDVWHWP